MHLEDALDRLLTAFVSYYTINREEPAAPFAAEAEFRLHDEQYFLIHSARISEADSREIVFFALTDRLDEALYARLDERAWEEGLSRAEVKTNHRNTDVGLCILAGEITPEASKALKKARHYKSYRLGLQGFSQYRTVAYDLSKGTCVRNRLGEELERVVSNIFQSDC